MTQIAESFGLRYTRTKNAVLWTSVLNEPLWTLYALFSFILHKDLHSTAIQIGVLTMLRPLVSLFSMYWSAHVGRRPEKLLSNVVWAGVLSRISFFFFPFIDNPWFLIASVSLYMMMTRGGTPAWVEILKLNLPGKARGQIFSYGSAFGYLEGVALAVGVGYMLDHYHEAWRWMFPVSAFIGIIGVYLQSRIPLDVKPREFTQKVSGPSVKDHIVQPWKNAFALLKENKSFLKFQWGIMLCGIGVMVIQPALPLYFIDVLELSYTDLAIALSIWKGIGFAVTSPFWGEWFSRISIYKLSVLIFILMGLFPLLLLIAPISTVWVYIAYLAYGIAQAGCHLSWNLSGPIFSKDKDSSLYSSVNLMMVGLRGSFAPPLGSFLCMGIGPVGVLAFGAILCFAGSIKMLQFDKKLKPIEIL